MLCGGVAHLCVLGKTTENMLIIWTVSVMRIDSLLKNPFSCCRSYSDFEFGLGSFSLLEEIVTGQEWAKFLNPNLSATSVRPGPSEEPPALFKAPANPYECVQSAGISNQQDVESNQWRYWSTDRRPGSTFSMAQISPVAPVHGGSMEVSESVHREADQSEPMDDGHNQSDVQPRERAQRRPVSSVQVSYHL